MINKIETIDLDDITQVEDKIQATAEQTTNRAKNVKECIGPMAKGWVEKLTGKKVDEGKFKVVFDKRAEDWKMDSKMTETQWKENYEKIMSKQGEVDVF